MDEKQLNAAERRGYGKGYAAGKRRKSHEISIEDRKRKKDAFWQRAFLAAIPAAFAAQGWKRGEKPISTIQDRMQLASEVADEATDHALSHL